MKASDLKKKFSRDKEEPTNQARKNRRLIIGLFFKVVLLFMVVVAVIYGSVSMLLGSSIFIPQNGREVLQSVKAQDLYFWTSESKRKIDFNGYREEQGIYRGVSLSLPDNAFHAMSWGLLREPAYFISDGEVAIRIQEEDLASSEDARDGVPLHDACSITGNAKTKTTGDDAPPSAELLAMPSAEMLLEGDPQIVSDQGTFLGQRAWVVSFDPSPDVIKRLLWVDFLDKALGTNPELAPDRLWNVSGPELKAIEEGAYETLWSNAWVTRDTRQLGQIDLRIKIDIGPGQQSEYRILAHTGPLGDSAEVAAQRAESLRSLQLGTGTDPGRQSLLCD